MRKVADINLLDERSPVLARSVRLTLAILGAGVVLAVILWILGALEQEISIWGVLAVVAASVVALPVHELVHAAFFKLLGGREARITFGMKTGMLYTSAEGLVLPKGRFSVVLLAPTVLVTAALVAGFLAAGRPLAAWFAAVIHLAGCTGDTATFSEVLRTPECTHVEDTDYGVALLADQDDV